MNLQILLFGISTDLVGATSINVSLPLDSSVLNLKNLIKEEYPKLSEINSYAIAVNESYASNETFLKENDVVAIIPPVSGG